MSIVPFLNTLVPVLITVAKGIMGGKSSTPTIEYRTDPAIISQLNEMNKRLVEMAQNSKISREELESERKKFNDLKKMADEQKKEFDDKMVIFMKSIESQTKIISELKDDADKAGVRTFDDLEKTDKKRFERIIELSKSIDIMPLTGHNVAFIGHTGNGKSSLINACFGKDICKTGWQQTTMEMKAYKDKSSDLVFWDVPGQTDKICYLTATYLAFIKSINLRAVMIVRTIDEITRTTSFMDKVGLRYIIIVNKVDLAPADELDSFKKQIRQEVKENCKNFDDIFFVSAKIPGAYDYDSLIDRLTDGTVKSTGKIEYTKEQLKKRKSINENKSKEGK